MVEHNLAKVGVASSNLVSRSSCGWMAEWLCSGLQSRGRRFDSGFSLCDAQVAKLVDARDLKSLGIIFRAGSSPALGTIFKKMGSG